MPRKTTSWRDHDSQSEGLDPCSFGVLCKLQFRMLDAKAPITRCDGALANEFDGMTARKIGKLVDGLIERGIIEVQSDGKLWCDIAESRQNDSKNRRVAAKKTSKIKERKGAVREQNPLFKDAPAKSKHAGAHAFLAALEGDATLARAFVDHRVEKKKPATDQALKMLANRRKEFLTVETYKEAIQTAIERGWQSIHPTWHQLAPEYRHKATDADQHKGTVTDLRTRRPIDPEPVHKPLSEAERQERAAQADSLMRSFKGARVHGSC